MPEKTLKGLEYTVRKTQFYVKDRFQPSSVYIELGLFPNSIDKFDIKRYLTTMSFPLEDILLLHDWDNDVKDEIFYLLQLKDVPYPEWGERALDLYAKLDRKLFHKIIRLEATNVYSEGT